MMDSSDSPHPLERLLDYGSGAVTPLAMPLAGAAYLFDTHPALEGLLDTLQSWTVPLVAYQYDPITARARNLSLGQQNPADYSALTSTMTEVIRSDGAWVPLSIVHRKDITLDGQNRAVVVGHGGYGISIQPYFDPLLNVFAAPDLGARPVAGRAFRPLQ